MSGMWEFWIDRGGTFTDILARTPDGDVQALKLLSDSEAYRDAASEGVRRLMGLSADAPLPANAVQAVKMGTTVATNALLEKAGAKTLFLVNEGYRDILRIGDQTRGDLFALNIEKPRPLYDQVIEIAGRMNADGQEITPLDADAAREALRAAKADGVEAIAIALMHAYANPAHEIRLGEIARDVGFSAITLSHAASPLIKIVPRASTAVMDAYLTPVLRDYVGRVHQRLDETPLFFMQSSGGLAQAHHFHARDAVLSGPAGGVVGMAMTAKAAGFDKVIGFDMGGTSTDVSRFDGQYYERTGETKIEGWTLRAPMLGIHTVAAGGGSVLFFDGERARVGPHSAGANPGPAGYGRGGPAAVTDANIVLGRIQAEGFPRVFGPDFNGPLDVAASRKALDMLAKEMGLESAEAAAEGFLTVAVEAMAGAIKHISIAQGIDPRGYALNAFGGAGGQHACKVAETLGMSTVLIHPHAGLLSAYGIGLASLIETREAAFDVAFDGTSLTGAKAKLETLRGEAEAALHAQGGQNLSAQYELRLRAKGSDTALPIALSDMAQIREDFTRAHKRLFGFSADHQALILDSVAVIIEAAPPGTPKSESALKREKGTPKPDTIVRLYDQGEWHGAPVYTLENLNADVHLTGPALILDKNQTIVLDHGWYLTRQSDGMVVMTRDKSHSPKTALSTELDPITLELFNRRFMNIAEQMGVVLERTAHSVNIKERLDFSCAIFDGAGDLVANAPHMPVHLGSMSASVRAALEAHPDMGPGDAIALNAPYNGGTHLPDVTVIQPVCDPTGERIFFVAARGHHGDIGGVQPGSMPPFSTTIDEEGAVYNAVKIVDAHHFQDDAARAPLLAGPYPARNPDQNIADLKAQLAACAKGRQALEHMVKDFGLDAVKAYMGHVQDNAERAVRRVIGALKDGAAVMQLDQGGQIAVKITLDQASQSAHIDFTGTSAQSPTNFNAPSAVARAAVLYVLRCLVDDDIPLNEGCLKPITLTLPEDCLLNPKSPAAVVAGNVETSQLVVDALFAATRRMAAAQGTMNNFTFGNARHQYYETICGGAGAGLGQHGGFDGASGVHTHMTNSRLTDPEVMERRYRVRIETHQIREASGGAGRFKGGDGTVRRITMLEPMEAALLSGRRTVNPPGLEGGEAGQPGAAYFIEKDGTRHARPALFSLSLKAGEAIEIHTPGGGGWGQPD
ncbi:hydantoinase B/oxoprolinase family protein [Woodsholea maritima]|uniref:hydantoinase B/oxoprolinase family protein n=1 Tax=Woodsholea maritima TaxID=240237 RepID=UPI00035FFB31|nr:hydantoinase B/oxoprolinase family protein [Woodsholea maritima]